MGDDVEEEVGEGVKEEEELVEEEKDEEHEEEGKVASINQKEKGRK